MFDGRRWSEVLVLLDCADVVEDKAASEAVEVGEDSDDQHHTHHAPRDPQVTGSPSATRHGNPGGPSHLISPETKDMFLNR